MDGTIFRTTESPQNGSDTDDSVEIGKWRTVVECDEQPLKLQNYDKSTQVGTGRELSNNNGAEVAVIPVNSPSASEDTNRSVTLKDRKLRRILLNNDSDDLKWPANPEHPFNGLWVPASKHLPLSNINPLDDALAPRIWPLAKTKTQGLSDRGNFGLPIWELKHDHIAAHG